MTAIFHTLPPPGPCDETDPKGIVMSEGSFFALLDALDVERAWMQLGNCQGVRPDLFFPDRGDSFTVRAAKACCDNCQVEVECLEYALVKHERYGIWGGASERERRKILNQRRKSVA